MIDCKVPDVNLHLQLALAFSGHPQIKSVSMVGEFHEQPKKAIHYFPSCRGWEVNNSGDKAHKKITYVDLFLINANVRIH